MNNIRLLLESLVLMPSFIEAGLRAVPILVKDAWQNEKTVSYYDGD